MPFGGGIRRRRKAAAVTPAPSSTRLMYRELPSLVASTVVSEYFRFLKDGFIEGNYAFFLWAPARAGHDHGTDVIIRLELLLDNKPSVLLKLYEELSTIYPGDVRYIADDDRSLIVHNVRP